MSRIVVVSNRVPVPQGNAGQAGGLAVALLGLMQRRGGLWFGWSGAVTDANAPPGLTQRGGVGYATIDLTEAEHRGYYTGYSNGVLWPMLHGLPHLMSFRRQDLDIYRKVNRRFADNLVPLLRRDDRIWVHDYHLLALPGALRQRGVLGATGFFLHVPFPAPDAAAVAPGIRGLVQDVLQSDLLGFQTAADRDNFAATAVGFAGAARLSEDVLELGGRPVRLGIFPAEIAAPEFAATAAAQAASEPYQLLARSLRGQALLLGVDRLDPTKGLPERLEAFRRVVARRAPRSLAMLQIAAPSREEVMAYRRLRQELDSAAGAINSEFGEPDWVPLRLLARPQTRDTVAGFMRQARVGVVTPIRDGMNLVAKEYVAAQDPADPGVLVLSRFAGAAAQLSSALLVNPHDAEGMAETICAALDMPLDERRARWRECWEAIADASPEGWGEAFLRALSPEDLARLPVAGTA
ncbi:trehalose-6-phosphate synthase [Roseicella sp. DB1501]|uniref:alpha,alpha-trehalose-phosphate synthase (UDP-forming) n=1 Tax=Roseicella sp. DB1501 TaxID=2730925 RepID=UPI0014929EA6|nr:trehalose-6-phosphate synthase [Roseicella sp. DB1501]NOG72537.1 trehalose-6-phosphate synthase [Roseicella sp. DB1501]